MSVPSSQNNFGPAPQPEHQPYSYYENLLVYDAEVDASNLVWGPPKSPNAPEQRPLRGPSEPPAQEKP
jgi:hypothetical protein